MLYHRFDSITTPPIFPPVWIHSLSNGINETDSLLGNRENTEGFQTEIPAKSYRPRCEEFSFPRMSTICPDLGDQLTLVGNPVVRSAMVTSFFFIKCSATSISSG